MGRFVLKAAAVAAAAVVAAAGAAEAKSPPPAPKSPGGRTVTLVARGVPTPTEFAVPPAASSSRDTETNTTPRCSAASTSSGVARRQGPRLACPRVRDRGGRQRHALPEHGPAILAGAAGTAGSSARRAWSRPARTGTRSSTGSPSGPDGLIYVGANPDTSRSRTMRPTSSRSIRRHGTISVVATGIRQPWQPLFLPGHTLPLVSDLNQDDLGPKRPPDFLLAIKRGANYGYPDLPGKCEHLRELRQAVASSSRRTPHRWASAS